MINVDLDAKKKDVQISVGSVSGYRISTGYYPEYIIYILYIDEESSMRK